ncbi:hypothetical protein UQW22_03520 [Isoptericola halotolerans]|uniref:hypothetical protein n=1 Tax=Isoptericola halotolerans TaxID=300560 RepID=UPI00388FCBDB
MTTTTVPPDVTALVARVTGDEKHDPSAHSILDVVWVLHVGVPRDAELRRYGTPRDHAAAHGLDAAGVRRQVKALLG